MNKYIKCMLWGLSCLSFISGSQAQERACPQILTPFVCKSKSGQKMGRCAASKATYSFEQDNTTYTCNPVIQATQKSRIIFLSLVQKPSESALIKFKESCDYSSPINFETDQEVLSAIRSIYTSPNPIAVRGLLFAEENCANETSHELILSWLGNEILISQPASVISAFYLEKKTQHVNDIAKRENVEWRKLKCKTEACLLQRNTFFESKLRAVKEAKINPNMESIRQELLESLQSITDVSKSAFLKLMNNPDSKLLAEFKRSCTKTSPIDFLGDKSLHDVALTLLSNGNTYGIRALIHADAVQISQIESGF